MSSVRVLFLAANPRSTSRLALDEEIRAIQQRLRSSEAAGRFDLRAELALRADELPAALMRHRPKIVHFSGHGSATGELLLVGAQADQITPVTPHTLRQVFKTLGRDLFCVVLNACFSEAQAAALVEIVPCAVGMERDVTDAGAIAFAAGFYEALAFDQDLQSAFELGCTATELAQQAGQHLVPRLLQRSDVNPRKLHLFKEAAELNVSRAPAVKDSLDLLPAAPKRIRLIQEVKFPLEHKLAMPQIDDLLTNTLHEIPYILGLDRGYFKKNSATAAVKSLLKGPIDNQKDGLVFSVEHNAGFDKKYQFAMELSEYGLFRLFEYVDDIHGDIPTINIKPIARRMAIFLYYSTRIGRRLGKEVSSRRWTLREVAGAVCKVDDWAMIDVLPEITAGVGLVYAPNEVSSLETRWVEHVGTRDGLAPISELVGIAIRELFYKFSPCGSERIGWVRPADEQLRTAINLIYKDFI